MEALSNFFRGIEDRINDFVGEKNAVAIGYLMGVFIILLFFAAISAAILNAN